MGEAAEVEEVNDTWVDALVADEREDRDDAWECEERAERDKLAEERGDALELRGVVSGGSTRADGDSSASVARSPPVSSVEAFREFM